MGEKSLLRFRFRQTAQIHILCRKKPELVGSSIRRVLHSGHSKVQFAWTTFKNLGQPSVGRNLAKRQTPLFRVLAVLVRNVIQLQTLSFKRGPIKEVLSRNHSLWALPNSKYNLGASMNLVVGTISNWFHFLRNSSARNPPNLFGLRICLLLQPQLLTRMSLQPHTHSSMLSLVLFPSLALAPRSNQLYYCIKVLPTGVKLQRSSFHLKNN